MKQHNVVIIYLSLSLLVVQFFWMRSATRVAYLEGKQSVYNSFSEKDNTNNCYAENADCVNNPNGEIYFIK